MLPKINWNSPLGSSKAALRRDTISDPDNYNGEPATVSTTHSSLHSSGPASPGGDPNKSLRPPPPDRTSTTRTTASSRGVQLLNMFTSATGTKKRSTNSTSGGEQSPLIGRHHTPDSSPINKGSGDGDKRGFSPARSTATSTSRKTIYAPTSPSPSTLLTGSPFYGEEEKEVAPGEEVQGVTNRWGTNRKSTEEDEKYDGDLSDSQSTRGISNALLGRSYTGGSNRPAMPVSVSSAKLYSDLDIPNEIIVLSEGCSRQPFTPYTTRQRMSFSHENEDEQRFQSRFLKPKKPARGANAASYGLFSAAPSKYSQTSGLLSIDPDAPLPLNYYQRKAEKTRLALVARRQQSATAGTVKSPSSGTMTSPATSPSVNSPLVSTQSPPSSPSYSARSTKPVKSSSSLFGSFKRSVTAGSAGSNRESSTSASWYTSMFTSFTRLKASGGRSEKKAATSPTRGSSTTAMATPRAPNRPRFLRNSTSSSSKKHAISTAATVATTTTVTDTADDTEGEPKENNQKENKDSGEVPGDRPWNRNYSTTISVTSMDSFASIFASGATLTDRHSDSDLSSYSLQSNL